MCRCAVWVATVYTRVVFVSKGIDYESQCNGEQCKSLQRRKGASVCMGGIGSIKTVCVIRPAQCLVTSPTNTDATHHATCTRTWGKQGCVVGSAMLLDFEEVEPVLLFSRSHHGSRKALL